MGDPISCGGFNPWQDFWLLELASKEPDHHIPRRWERPVLRAVRSLSAGANEGFGSWRLLAPSGPKYTQTALDSL